MKTLLTWAAVAALGFGGMASTGKSCDEKHGAKQKARAPHGEVTFRSGQAGFAVPVPPVPPMPAMPAMPPMAGMAAPAPAPPAPPVAAIFGPGQVAMVAPCPPEPPAPRRAAKERRAVIAPRAFVYSRGGAAHDDDCDCDCKCCQEGHPATGFRTLFGFQGEGQRRFEELYRKAHEDAAKGAQEYRRLLHVAPRASGNWRVRVHPSQGIDVEDLADVEDVEDVEEIEDVAFDAGELDVDLDALENESLADVLDTIEDLRADVQELRAEVQRLKQEIGRGGAQVF